MTFSEGSLCQRALGMTVFHAVTIVAVAVIAARGSLVKRSDDVQPLEDVVQNLSTQVSLLQAKLQVVETTLQQLQAAESRTVVFTASIADHDVKAAPRHVIPFSRVITNVGNAHDANIGAFTAPYDGQYMLFVSVDVSADYKSLDICRNGQVVIPGHNDAGDHHIFAGGAITLKTGDEVTIRHHTGAVGSVDGGPEAIFCGFKI